MVNTFVTFAGDRYLKCMLLKPSIPLRHLLLRWLTTVWWWSGQHILWPLVALRVVCVWFRFYYMNTCWAPHLEMSPKYFTMATMALLSAFEQTQCAPNIWNRMTASVLNMCTLCVHVIINKCSFQPFCIWIQCMLQPCATLNEWL